MIAINLSGIKSLDIPTSLFDEFFKRQAGAIKQGAYPEGFDIHVDIVHEKENPYQTENEPALAVMLDNCIIGYIPVLSTIERYVNEAWEARGKAMSEGDKEAGNEWFKRWEKHSERYAAAHTVRRQVELDLFHSHIPARGILSRVQLDYNTGEVMSVSVSYDAM